MSAQGDACLEGMCHYLLLGRNFLGRGANLLLHVCNNAWAGDTTKNEIRGTSFRTPCTAGRTIGSAGAVVLRFLAAAEDQQSGIPGDT